MTEKKKRARLSPEEKAARKEARLDAARKARKEKRDAAWTNAQNRMRDLEQRVRAAGPNCDHEFARAAHRKSAEIDEDIRKLRRAYRVANDAPPGAARTPSQMAAFA